MSEAKIQTAKDLLSAFHQLPESEQVLMLQQISSSAPHKFDNEKFTEIYKDRLFEVYRSKATEEYHGGKFWVASYSPDKYKMSASEFYRSAEE